MICYICRQLVREELSQDHHLVPQSVGMTPNDSEANLKTLHSGCHHNLHRIAERILHGQSGLAQDLSESLFPNDSGSARRMLEAAHLCATEMQAARDGDRDLPDIVSVSFEIPRQVYLRLRTMGIEWNGGRLGVAPMLRYICYQMTEKHFAERDSAVPTIIERNFD